MLRTFLKSRVPVGGGPGCAPNCKLILEDLEKHGKLTDYPKDYNGASIYPVEGKILHLFVELVGVHAEVEDPMELLPALMAKIRSLVIRN